MTAKIINVEIVSICSSNEISIIKTYYYMVNPVLGKLLCSDWFLLGQNFAVRTVSMEMVQSVYFCFGAKPANSKFATKTAKKKSVNVVIPGADPGEVKWVNFHPPFSEPP